MKGLSVLLGGMVLAGLPAVAGAAELPAHDPLRIVVVSDEVNPHMLPEGDLTQPGELAAAIGNAGSGINVAEIDEVSSQCIDDALVALTQGVDVLVYFAHLAARGCDNGEQQADFTLAVQQHLEAGGGVVVFHHGIYSAAGKEAILQLLGGRADSVLWDTMGGQDVIAVSPEHFVASQGVDYSGMRMFSGAGVAAGEYPFFNNTPDERYDSTTLLTEGGESRTILFASAQGDGSAARVLGYDLHRPGWGGHVVFYQPGEYQPQALGDLDGNNFQILANAIVYAGTTQEEGGGETSAGTSGATSGDTVDDSGPGTSADSDPTAGSSVTATTGDTTPGADDGGGGGDGCSCRSGSQGSGALPWMVGLLGLAVGRRRRGR